MSAYTNTASQKFAEEEEDDESMEEAHIEWSNLIFLPFHPVFKLIVLFSVIVKSTLGPIQSVYPIVYCWDVMDRNLYLSFIKYFYWYCCDSIYGIDTFLHIAHRQVTDKAMRREHLPKSAFLLLIDMISLVPFFRLLVSDVCPPTQLWPNVLAFCEFIVIYRVVEFFSLLTTHSPWKIVTGFSLLIAVCVNCVACFWLLLTKHGLCRNCNNAIYDWRSYVMHKLNETDEGFATYVYGSSYVLSFVINTSFDETKPSAVLEFFVITIFMIAGHLLEMYVIIPKLFAEGILRLRRICTYHPHVNRLVNETRRRNVSPKAFLKVLNFYKVIWRKRSGITCLPEVIHDLPRCLRLEVRQDLLWPFFYHSPTLRRTSSSFKRWLCEFIQLDYKLAGEKFFAGPHCFTNLYYLKSGVVQMLSSDDGTTPILSVTSGTVFGDINFLLPPLKRKVMVRCLTYCEVYFACRRDLLRAIYKYPKDRNMILQSAKERIKHARTLFACKQHVRGLDRTEDEGIAWVKRRWWEISTAVAVWKKKVGQKDEFKCELPPEEAVYHCAKYIGQLVLCAESQLHTKSMFSNVKFPWILVPNSSFGIIWRQVVNYTVLQVLMLYPPFITMKVIPAPFKFLQFWTDLIYALDICVSLMTSMMKQEYVTTNFAEVMFARCKSLNFFLDVLSTLWIENLTIIVGKPEFYYMVQFNRLIKIYKLFSAEFAGWDVKRNPIISICYKIALTQFSFMYILGHFVYMLDRHIPDLSTDYFFGEKNCGPGVPENECDIMGSGFFDVALSWVFELLFFEYLPKKLIDIYFAMVVGSLGFITYVYCKSRFIASLYLKYVAVADYQYFVSNLKKYYQYYKIHSDLLKRLDRYLMCHWKYYQGMDVMHPNMLKDEPYGIYWKVHGEVADRVINGSRAFAGSDSALVKELASIAKYLILPKNATLFLFGFQCKNVTWIVQGTIKCEYHNEAGELLKIFYGPKEMLSVSSIFLGRAALRTYTSATECEILYIKINDFFKVIKRYPDEWSYFENCIREYGRTFDEIFQAYVRKHREYQQKLRDRTFYARMSAAGPTIRQTDEEENIQVPFEGDFWGEPESQFMNYWMLFRAIIVFVSISSASLQGGSGAVYRWHLVMVGAFCDCIAWMDIIIKLFLAYYDERGLLITDKYKCMVHYLTRSFLLDIIGALPWFEVIRLTITKDIDDNNALLINTLCKFAHLYIIYGYFNYIGDVPTINVAFIMILKWQAVLLLIMLGASHYLMSHCVSFTFDSKTKFDVINMTKTNTCWIPRFFEINEEPTVDQLHLLGQTNNHLKVANAIALISNIILFPSNSISFVNTVNLTICQILSSVWIFGFKLFAQSLNLVQCGLMRWNFGRFHIDRTNMGVGLTLFFLGLLYWYVVCYSLTLLVLNFRGNTLYRHSINKLSTFLIAERVDPTLISRATRHFRYWWIRTKGINIHHLTSERIGVVFRQDLSYYFFRKTFTALDTLLQGGEALVRQLASASSQMYYLSSEEVIREMDLTASVFVVHRGKVTISQKGEKLVTLTKGGIFGQLDSSVIRPVRISAKTDGYADLLQINIKQFQELIPDEVRANISKNPQAKDDFMATMKHFTENPYNTIQYILRGRKTIKLPWMVDSLKARHGNWYSKWLYFAWIGVPAASAVIVLVMDTFPKDLIVNFYWSLFILDLIFLVNLMAEFYTVELTVVDNKCVNRLIGLRMFKNWGFYIDAFSLLIPLITFITSDWRYQLARLLRLRLFYDFHANFCRSFKSKATPILMKLIIVFLLFHAMTCGWIHIACRGKFPIKTDLPVGIKLSIDDDQWVSPNDRDGGCARVTKNYEFGKFRIPSFLVPKNWQNDYIVASTFIILILTHTSIDAVIALSLHQIYYKIVVNFFIFLIDMWIMSMAISAMYTRLRELYQYDYYVDNLTTYLSHTGLSPTLLESVKEYTSQLWQRQRGNWLPELAKQAPVCLREDLLGSLYMHHLNTPPLFRQLPSYFTRQLVARLKRVVVFPGKFIVQEGDIYPIIYFIHEGEVEKWFIDKKGESRMISLLTINGYFGLIPGLFPNTPFQFSYYSRTVVDLIFLRLRDWQDLLDGYPEVKRNLYAAAKQLKRGL